MDNRKRFLSVFLMSMWLAGAGLPALSTEVFTGGQDGYGAQINDLGGANINYNTGTEAQIGITGNGNVIKWDYLNVGQGNKLDYNFTQAGQVSLNKVQGGVSKFAGTVSTSGENGHLIISNPNGVIFMDGSVTNINAGSATFTTHDANWDGQKNGKITTNSNGTNKGITIGNGTGPVPVFKVNKDLNIIAPGVDVTGADLFAGGTVRMVSADGVNFVAGTHTPEISAKSTMAANAVQYARVNGGNTTYTSGDNNAIKIANTAVRATNSYSVDGHLYLAADADINVKNLSAGILNATGQNIAIANSTTGDLTANAAKSISVDGLNSDKNVRLIADDKIDAKNITAKNTIWALNAKEVNAKNLTAHEIYLGTSTKAKGGQSYNETWHNEWYASADNVVAENINATLAMNIFSKNKMDVKGLTSNGDMVLSGNLIKAADLRITGQMDRPWAPGNKTIGISIQKNDDNAAGTLNLQNAESAVQTFIYGFDNVIASDITTPIFIAESTKNLTINNLKTDDLYFSGLYYNLFGTGSPITANINGLASLSGDTIRINKDFDVSTFNPAIDAVQGYKYNMLVLDINDYFNMSFDENSNLIPVQHENALTSLTITNSDANLDLGRISTKNGASIATTGNINVTGQTVDGDLRLDAGKNVTVDGLNSNANVTLIANDTINAKNMSAKGTILAMNADSIIADSLKANFIVLGGSTKDKGLQTANIGNASWHNEWNASAKSIIANNIEADLDLRLLSRDTVVADGLKSGGDIRLQGNNVTASNIEVTDQKILTNFPSTNTTLGLYAQTYDSWASGWGAPNNGGAGSTLTLNNVNIADKSASVQISAFETVKGSNITAPIFIAESVKNMDIAGLKVDDMHFSNLYYTLFGGSYFDLENLNITGISAFTQGGDVTLNKSFDPANFNGELDKTYGYKHNLLVLQYLNGDYDKVNAKNTNTAIVNYVDGISLSDGKVSFGEPDTNNNNTNGASGSKTGTTGIMGEEIIQKIGEDIDTIFRKQFTHKGFAASDEEIEEMKIEAAKNTIKGNNGLIKVMKEFRAY